jgi:hypothetical protein
MLHCNAKGLCKYWWKRGSVPLGRLDALHSDGIDYNNLTSCV